MEEDVCEGGKGHPQQQQGQGDGQPGAQQPQQQQHQLQPLELGLMGEQQQQQQGRQGGGHLEGHEQQRAVDASPGRPPPRQQRRLGLGGGQLGAEQQQGAEAGGAGAGEEEEHPHQLWREFLYGHARDNIFNECDLTAEEERTLWQAFEAICEQVPHQVARAPASDQPGGAMTSEIRAILEEAFHEPGWQHPYDV